MDDSINKNSIPEFSLENLSSQEILKKSQELIDKFKQLGIMRSYTLAQKILENDPQNNLLPDNPEDLSVKMNSKLIAFEKLYNEIKNNKGADILLKKELGILNLLYGLNVEVIDKFNGVSSDAETAVSSSQTGIRTGIDKVI